VGLDSVLSVSVSVSVSRLIEWRAMEYQVSVTERGGGCRSFTFTATSDDAAVSRVLRYARPVEKLHNVSTTPATLLVRHGADVREVSMPNVAPLTLAEASDLVGDDIAYWLNNPFVASDFIAGKVCWWITKAAARAIPPEVSGP
jgi:hypothetical protein